MRKWDFFIWKNKKPTEQEFQEKGVIVVLQYGAHCKHCIYEMKKCCQKMKGVLSAELDEEVPEIITVKGVFEVEKLVAHIRRGVEKIVTVLKEESVAGGVGDGDSGAGAAAAGGDDGEIKEEEGER